MALGIGLVGCGEFAAYHLEAFVRNDGVDRVFAADLNEDARDSLHKRFGIIQGTVAEYQELLADDEVDVVDILTPHDSHREIAVAALRAGKDVICEKPIARTLEEADEMIAAAEETGRRLFIAMSQRNFPAHRRAKELIEEGTIGHPFLTVANVYDNDMARMNDPDHWKGDVERAGGGAIIDVGYHAIYRMQDMFGPAEAVTALCRRLVAEPSNKGDDTAVMALDLPGDVLGSIVLTFAATGHSYDAETRIVGAEGTLIIRDTPQGEMPLLLYQDENFIPLRVHSPLDVSRHAVQVTLDHFIECIVEGTEAELTVEEARAALATAVAGYESERTGQRVPVR